jgi:predicted RNA methylase
MTVKMTPSIDSTLPRCIDAAEEGTRLLSARTGRTDDAATLDKYQVDYTPTAAALMWTISLIREIQLKKYIRMLDPAAGSGVFGRVARAVWGERVHTTGIDVRPSERENLAAAYDESQISDFHKARLRGPFDLVLTNPPFMAFAEAWWEFLLSRHLLAENAVIAFVGLSQWGQTRRAWPQIQRWTPAEQHRIGGRLSFRGGAAADQREYSLWIWRKGHHTRGAWRTLQLPPLPRELAKWTDPPGLHPVEPALLTQVIKALS